MTWQVLIGLSVIMTSFATLLQRYVLRSGKVTPGAFGIFVGLMCGAILSVIAYVQGKLSFTGFAEWWPNILLAALTYGVGGTLANFALQKTEASKFTVLFATRGLITILIAMVFLGEPVSLWRGVGALAIFLGVAIASWQAQQVKFQTGDWFALIAALIYGVANINDRIALQHMSLYPYLILAYVLPTFLIAAAMPKSMPEIKAIFTRTQFPSVMVLTVLFLLSGITFFAALQIVPNTAQVAAINLTSVVLIVALSVVFLKETLHWPKKLLGAIVTLIGLLLLV